MSLDQLFEGATMKFLKSQASARLAMAAVISLSIAASAVTATAQYGRRDNNTRERILEWQGQVDREIRIQIDNRRASVIEVGSNERTRRRGDRCDRAVGARDPRRASS